MIKSELVALKCTVPNVKRPIFRSTIRATVMELSMDLLFLKYSFQLSRKQYSFHPKSTFTNPEFMDLLFLENEALNIITQRKLESKKFTIRKEKLRNNGF